MNGQQPRTVEFLSAEASSQEFLGGQGPAVHDFSQEVDSSIDTYGVKAEQQQQQQPLEAPDQSGIHMAQASAYISKIQAHIFRRRCRCAEFFQQFDNLHTGRCSRDQFRRALVNLMHTIRWDDPDSKIDVEWLMDYYTPPAEEFKPEHVDYRSFCRDVDEVYSSHSLEKRPLHHTPRPGAAVIHSQGFNPRPTQDERKLRDVMGRLATMVRIRGINLDTCFEDVQRPKCDTRAGRITPEAFLTHFPLAKTTATQRAMFDKSELDVVVQRYTDDKGFFRLFPFASDVHELAGMRPPPGEGAPLTTPRRCDLLSPLSTPRPHSAAELGHPGSPQIDPFGDMPRTRPKSECMHLSGTNRFDGVNITVLQKDRVKPDIMVRIQKAVADRRLRVYPFFREADVKKKGFCTQGQALAALTVLKLELDRSEAEDVLNRYRGPDGLFCYPAFCADAEGQLGFMPSGEPTMHTVAAGHNGAAAVRALSARGTTPNKLNFSVASPNTTRAAHLGETSATGAGDLMPSESPVSERERRNQLNDLHARLLRTVRSRGLELVQVFADFNKTHWSKPGHVTACQFARVFDMLNLGLSQTEKTLLFEAYCDRDETGAEFNYAAFCAAVDESHVMSKTGGVYGVTPRMRTMAAPRVEDFRLPSQAHPAKYFDTTGKVKGTPRRPCSQGTRKTTQRTPRTVPPPSMRIISMTG